LGFQLSFLLWKSKTQTNGFLLQLLGLKKLPKAKVTCEAETQERALVGFLPNLRRVPPESEARTVFSL
jgi:hypothetical protein